MKSSYQPTLDVLEERLCMSSVRLLDRGQTLQITGNNRDNTVIMADNTYHGLTAVFIDNEFHGVFDATKITRVNVDLKGGHDHFRFHTATEGGADFPPGYFYAKQFKINMGAGNDTVNYDFEWANGIYSGISAGMALDINAGAGNDQVFIRLGSIYANVSVKAVMGDGNDIFDAHVIGRVDDAARLTYNVRGDAGADKIFADYVGQMDGVLDLLLDGGKNDDEIRSYNTLPTDAHGSVKGRVLGNVGNDKLDFSVGGFVWYSNSPKTIGTQNSHDLTDAVFTQFENWSVDGMIDGGAGFDSFRKSANIGQVNCEQNF